MTGGNRMKQTDLSTFILDRNGIEYYLVEGKSSLFMEPVYYVYYKKDEKPIAYNLHNFVEIHGLDHKETVEGFTRQALLNLAVLQGTSEDISTTYNKFYDVYEQVQKSSNPKRPVLGKHRDDLIEALDHYNALKEMLPKGPEISYIEDYLLVSEEEDVEQNREVISLESYQKTNESELEEENVKGIQRVLKKDVA